MTEQKGRGNLYFRSNIMAIEKIMKGAAKALNVLGSISIILMLIVTTLDVIMNKLFNSPFPGATELITSIMPISVFGFLLSTQIEERHISIDILVSRLSGKYQLFFKIFASASGLFIFALIFWLTTPLALKSIRMGEHTGGNIPIPMYPAKIVITLACGFVSVQLLRQLIKCIAELIKKRSSPKNSEA